jgi:hypothetical protein
LLATTAYNAFQDLYAACHEGGGRGMPADLLHPEDYRRMKNWKTEVDRCRQNAKHEEARNP